MIWPGGHSPEQVLADFKAFVQAVRAGQPDVPIYFISIKPSPSRAKFLDKIREANRLIEALTKEGKELTYVDVFTPLNGRRPAQPELFGPDKLHMNHTGYEVWYSDPQAVDEVIGHEWTATTTKQ